MRELVPYSETKRDLLEQQLAAERDKVDLLERRGGGLIAILYYMMNTCVLTVYIEDERQGLATEFEVTPEEAREVFEHAHSDPRNTTPIYNPYGEGD